MEYLIKLVIPLICLLNQMDIFQSRESITAHGSQKSNLPMLGHKIASWIISTVVLILRLTRLLKFLGLQLLPYIYLFLSTIQTLGLCLKILLMMEDGAFIQTKVKN